MFPLFATLLAGIPAAAQTGGDTLRRIVEVAVSGKDPERVEVGAVGCRGKSVFSIHSNQEAVMLIRPPRAGTLESVRVDLPFLFRGSGQAHLVFYAPDSTGKPGKKILEDSTAFVRADGRRHNRLRLGRHHLEVDTGGIFIGLTCAQCDTARYSEKRLFVGFGLNMTDCNPDARMFFRSSYGWFDYYLVEESGPRRHLDLSATFRLYP